METWTPLPLGTYMCLKLKKSFAWEYSVLSYPPAIEHVVPYSGTLTKPYALGLKASRLLYETRVWKQFAKKDEAAAWSYGMFYQI